MISLFSYYIDVLLAFYIFATLQQKVATIKTLSIFDPGHVTNPRNPAH